jgi:hypothetical protein
MRLEDEAYCAARMGATGAQEQFLYDADALHAESLRRNRGDAGGALVWLTMVWRSQYDPYEAALAKDVRRRLESEMDDAQRETVRQFMESEEVDRLALVAAGRFAHSLRAHTRQAA